MTEADRRLVVAPLAMHDLREIYRYSIQNWSETRALEYDRALRDGFRRLLEHPAIGQLRPDLGAELRSFSVREHRIIYRVTPDTIRVLRVLHHRRDPDSTSL
jgi:toxin ParE1/3/4